ncbi:hypothetical protein NLI96_g13326 [Meripilus lineatus]|uniref:Uncharacterized protein n=1 Tax=Meripilus lineatus TaxID=2056292 RepID=A0AAD5UNB3_9APHY|nr:hypothetical protein NLI96_g13326 [Physisporinus lineatus]
MLGNQQRFEAAVTIARYLDTDRAVLGQDCLGARAIALVAYGAWLGSARRVAEMVTHLAAQRSLDQCLLKGQRRGIDRFSCHRTAAELFKQLGGNRWQVYRFGFRFARHIVSFGTSYALNTKLLTGPHEAASKKIADARNGSDVSR